MRPGGLSESYFLLYASILARSVHIFSLSLICATDFLFIQYETLLQIGSMRTGELKDSRFQ